MSHDLRASISAMARLVAAQEEAALLGQSQPERERVGSPHAWSLPASVAHNSEFKRQQVIRLRAAARREIPPEFPEIDHASADVYRTFAQLSWEAVLGDSRQTTSQLLDGLWAVTDEDLTQPERNPWLRGRPLWLQVVVRSFWHPGSHLSDCFFDRGESEGALRLHRAGVALAEAVSLPEPALGMAHYALGCAHARSGNVDQGLVSIGMAVQLNPDLAKNARRDPDLESARTQPGWPVPAA